MRSFISMAILAFMALLAAVSAIPITPAAPEHQLLVEQFRSEGMKEHEIAERLSLPTEETEADQEPFFSRFKLKLHSLLDRPSEEDRRDVDGDIPPGSLDAPEMLPRAAAPDSVVDRISETISAVFRREYFERRRFGYEGKELEMRRPEGMRHWG